MHWGTLWLALIGLAVGAYGTLIGAGGGFILVPLLLLLYPNERPEVVTSISLAVVLCNAASGSLAYGRMKRIDYRSAWIFSAASVPGAILGAMSTSKIPRREFDGMLGCVMLAVALYLVLRPGGRGGKNGATPDAQAVAQNMSGGRLALGVGLSALVGYVSSLLGIGGGIIHVPMMIQLLDFPVHVATATSHLVLALVAAAGTAVHLVEGGLQHAARRTAALAIGVLIGAQIGAKLSAKIHGDWIVRGLALALGAAGARLLALSLTA